MRPALTVATDSHDTFWHAARRRCSAGAGLDAATGNPMRVAQLATVNLPAAALFLIASDVLDDPAPTAAVLAGALAGGYLGARVARLLPARVLRAIG